MTFLEAAKFILEQKENNPMTCSEIWQEIVNQDLIKVDITKTQIQSLNTILHRADLFLTIPGTPDKFIYKRYVSKNVKESLIENGFLTVEKLLEILKKNNINISL